MPDTRKCPFCPNKCVFVDGAVRCPVHGIHYLSDQDEDWPPEDEDDDDYEDDDDDGEVDFHG